MHIMQRRLQHPGTDAPPWNTQLVVRTAGVGIYSAAVNANAVSQPSSLNQFSQLRFSFL